MNLHHIPGKLDPGSTMITNGNLEHAPGPDGEEVGVIGVVVHDAPLRTQQLDLLDHPGPATAEPPSSSPFAPLLQPRQSLLGRGLTHRAPPRWMPPRWTRPVPSTVSAPAENR